MTEQAPAEQATSLLALLETEPLIRDLRRRARRLRAYATSILALIVVILAMGSWVFVSADTRALNDAIRGESPDSAKFAKLDDRLAQLESDRANLIARRAAAQKQYYVGRKSSFDAAVQNELVRKPLDEMAIIDIKVGEIDGESTALNRERKKLIATLPKDARIALTISALTTRVGAVVLLLFLVQILTPLFRYNMILATHYDACADGLTLVPGASRAIEAQVLEQVVRTMSPHTVTFGDAPQTLVERTVEAAAGVLSKK